MFGHVVIPVAVVFLRNFHTVAQLIALGEAFADSQGNEFSKFQIDSQCITCSFITRIIFHVVARLIGRFSFL